MLEALSKNLDGSPNYTNFMMVPLTMSQLEFGLFFGEMLSGTVSFLIALAIILGALVIYTLMLSDVDQ